MPSRKHDAHNVGYASDTDKLAFYDPDSSITESERILEEEEVSIRKSSRLFVTLAILVTEMCERLTYYSIAAGLILFCTSKLNVAQVDATTINQVFSGFVYLIPIFGGFLSDSYLGRFKTIFASCMIYLLGLLLLPVAAIDFDAWFGSSLETTEKLVVFLIALLLVALGTGGIKANVGPFGAEQVQSLGTSAVQSFFNWFYWVINIGSVMAYAGVSYVQQEISFSWGFFIPLASMLVAVIIFVTVKNQYVKTTPKGSILITAFGICRQGIGKTEPQPDPMLPANSEKAILARAKKSFGGDFDDNVVNGVVSVIKVIPFCLLVIMYWAIYAQMNNTFFAQAERMNLALGDGMNVPAAALNVFNSLSIILFIPVVDRIVYPCMRMVGLPLTYLKRIGVGMVIATVAMAVAGVVEIYRKIELNKPGGWHEQHLAGEVFNASSLSVFVQIPQFALVGVSEIFTSITTLEFAYNQAPVAMQGLLTGLFLAASGLGNWVSMLILIIVEKATADDPWWGDDINNTKMENLMFLLGGMMIVNFTVFCVVAHFYNYQDPKAFEVTVDPGDEWEDEHTMSWGQSAARSDKESTTEAEKEEKGGNVSNGYGTFSKEDTHM